MIWRSFKWAVDRAMNKKRSTPTVVYAFPKSHRFRAPFHHALKVELARRGVRYRYVFAGNLDNAGKEDTDRISWADDRPAFRPLGRKSKLIWHRIWDTVAAADLVILQQENGLLANYPVLLRSWLGGTKVALFGHGRNFQAASPNSVAERWKRLWSFRVHWWFAYTARCADIVADAGFPRDKITVFNNSIDLTGIARERAELSPERQVKLRQDLVGGSPNVGVYVGGLYAEKRLEFLIAAADEIKLRLGDFHLLVIGAGPDEDIVARAAKTRPWIHLMGPKFGMEKTEAVSLAKVWLMPGLVGLSILDSFAYDTPMVTTDLPYHSPEIDYLEDGTNAVMVPEFNDPRAYADAVARVLTDDDWYRHLTAGGREARGRYSIEEMARRFADGVIEALGS